MKCRRTCICSSGINPGSGIPATGSQIFEVVAVDGTEVVVGA